MAVVVRGSRHIALLAATALALWFLGSAVCTARNATLPPPEPQKRKPAGNLRCGFLSAVLPARSFTYLRFTCRSAVNLNTPNLDSFLRVPHRRVITRIPAVSSIDTRKAYHRPAHRCSLVGILMTLTILSGLWLLASHSSARAYSSLSPARTATSKARQR